MKTKKPHSWIFCARPVRAIDGDTIEVVIDHGFWHYSHQRIRIKGIDCPEMRSPDPSVRELAVKAQASCEWWLSVALQLSTDWPLRIETSKQSFERWVGAVFDIDGNSLADFLVSAGCATRVN